MTRTTLTIVAIAATIVSTSNFAQASFKDSLDDVVRAEVGQDIVYLGDKNKKQLTNLNGRSHKARHNAQSPNRRRGSKANSLVKF